jgi:hypothetical protein
MTATRLILRVAQLDTLENFLNHVVADAVRELEDVERRAQEGEFGMLEDLEFAESASFSRIEIASHAVAQELVNLVEHEFQILAHLPWLQSNHKGPKTLTELGARDDPSKLRMVSELRIDKIIPLIDSHYCISVRKIQGWIM